MPKSIVNRLDYIDKIEYLLKVNPAVAILGPRQCGKTTLANTYAAMAEKKKAEAVHYFDLENPNTLARLSSPMLALEELNGLIVIDEIQRYPDLFPILRVLIDQSKTKRKFLILGSASRDLIHQTSETLAGRISYLELTPFSFPEVNDLNRLWIRGGYPNSYLAQTNQQSWDWRLAYISTFLEKDIPNLGIQIPTRTLRRFWMMITHYHGNIFNASEIGKSLGVAHTTARHYLDILTGTFMIRELTPWIENTGKRQIKSPKIYFRDSGIYHALLNIPELSTLHTHPKLGASWEGFALESVIRHHQASPEEVYFWGVHAQAELDLFIIKNGKRLGFEVKYTDSPKLTTSMRSALEFLKLDQLTVIYPGKNNFPLADNIRAVGLEEYLSITQVI